MDTKSSVVKSKSSNSTKTNRSDQREQNKKSRSNVEFQRNVLKKRGVYVEKKYTTMGINETAETQVQERPMKAPPRPRAGNKKFLASVLSILSKSTAGTQYPDTNDTITKKKFRRRVAVRKNPNNVENKDVNERKTKYKSKALNDEVEKEVNQEKVVVLQSQRDMIQTPSINSENDSFNWLNLPLLVKDGQKNKEIIEKNVNTVANELAKEIREGQKLRKDKRVRIDEPNTLECVTSKEPYQTVTNEKDKGLYNFFVDLLETTISVYNVNADFEKGPNSPGFSSVKIPLEIDESVAKKLDVKHAKPENVEETAQPENKFYCLSDLEYSQQRASSPPLSPLKCPRKKKFLAESFSFLKKPTKKKMKTEYVATSTYTKKQTRKQQKKTLINLFKEQLRMDDDEFEEPQNMYEALKVIAQNKRKCQMTIHFENPKRNNKRDMGYPECMFKSRKVISPSTKLTRNKNARPIPSSSISGRYSEINSSKKKQKPGYVSESDDSFHSLQVYGLDYYKPAEKKPQLEFAYHSTPSDSTVELEMGPGSDSFLYNGYDF